MQCVFVHSTHQTLRYALCHIAVACTAVRHHIVVIGQHVCRAVADIDLSASNADAIIRTPQDRQMILGQFFLYLMQVTGNGILADV